MSKSVEENVYTLFRSQFSDRLNRVFLETSDGQAWTYADVDAESGRLANLLINIGLAPGDRVVVQVEKSPRAFFLYLACLRSGLIYLPLNPAYRETELKYFLADAAPGGGRP